MRNGAWVPEVPVAPSFSPPACEKRVNPRTNLMLMCRAGGSTGRRIVGLGRWASQLT